jgi:hypothetical protein
MVETWKSSYRTFKIDHGVMWLKVYDLNATNGKFTKEEAYFCLNKNKFSLLSHLGDSKLIKRYNSSYEFLLEYPENYEGEYNRWLQEKNPFDDIETYESTQATGYVPIHISWSSYKWGGLMKDSNERSLLNGEIGRWNWHYAIGDYTYLDYANSTPGPGHSCSRAVLWIRVNAEKYFPKSHGCSFSLTVLHGYVLTTLLLS